MFFFFADIRNRAHFRDLPFGGDRFSNCRSADDFALQFKVRAGDLGVTEVYDPETDGLIPVEPNDQVWPVVEAMPMGWSWALHVCTHALEHVVRITRTGTGRDLARERCESPLMTVAEPVCSVYVDKINVHGISPESCDSRHEVVIAAPEARGFSRHEVSRASQQHTVGRVLRRGCSCFTTRSSSPLEGPSCSSLSPTDGWSTTPSRARFNGPLGTYLLASCQHSISCFKGTEEWQAMRGY